MCGPPRDSENFMPEDAMKGKIEKCIHGVSLNKVCLMCDAKYGDEPIRAGEPAKVRLTD
jgi:hypothetical protein